MRAQAGHLRCTPSRANCDEAPERALVKICTAELNESSHRAALKSQVQLWKYTSKVGAMVGPGEEPAAEGAEQQDEPFRGRRMGYK